ncbi:hypothetical protein [Paenibacillus sp. MMO-58]|uniref:hypothetical protein n=1 Tax=Paenibacillus sp. MMO-58 TaxID=3081290 RepID=UPI0030194A47
MLNIAARMTEVINESGFTAGEVAVLAGYHPNYLKQMHAGKIRWTEQAVDRIGKALDLEVKLVIQPIGG